MSPENIPKIINSIGLAFDIVGAWLVAWEVVRTFKGQQYEVQPLIANGENPPPKKTEKYKTYESDKHCKMLIGLFCLTIGFSFQFLSNWIYSPQAITTEAPKTNTEVNKPIKPNERKNEEPKPPASGTINNPKTTKPAPD